MIYYILTALFIVAYLVEIFYFCRGLVNKSPKEMINYLKEFKKIKERDQLMIGMLEDIRRMDK